MKDLNVFNQSLNNGPSSTFSKSELVNLLDCLDDLSYKTKLNKNLKNTLRKFDKEELMEDLRQSIKHYRLFIIKLSFKNYRIKSLHSIHLKYDKYYPSKEVKSCFNDVLGFRVLVPSLSNLLIDLNEFKDYSNFRIVDLSNGKANDDGYRGVHLYYQKSNYHYPIEVQFWNESDYEFHNWLHKYSYKYLNNGVGVLMRDLFEKGLIKSEEDFLVYLNKE